MKIDRHNYEEFFLLYVDNELTDEQRKLVDEFTQQNPDLAIELKTLQQTTLIADDSIVFDRKEILLKKESDSFINLGNYEEYLISYIDNELTDAERIAFFKFALANPAVKDELSVYQQTKLQPEKEIVFENKQILYRKEETVKVISIQWWKIAVAAAVILAAGITTLKLITNNKPIVTAPAVAKTDKIKTDKKATEKTVHDVKKETSIPVKEQTIQDNADNIASTADQKKKEKNAAIQKTTEQKIQKKLIAPAVKENNESIAVNNKPVKNNSVTNNNSTDNTNAIDAAVKKSTEPVRLNDVAVNTSIPTENINSKAVTPVTDEPLDNKETAQEITNENAVYASYDEGKNKKLRGFFRKAARAFERRTNISAADEEKQDKVLIGALAVKLK